ncbi:TetR/AcrR family transcriptional regulator [Nocardia sp. NBC_01327]|uniref:TetR/AcrR family transcriptional regulator n=1 Tax=Nocardia sp. NBC_01327 TaxID=2903593 RepID=UPI002E14B81A|nr:TetR/AcrR family transcriptional regulator [Nocardia sp. NBC_01327]
MRHATGPGTKGVPRLERERRILAAATLRFGTDGYRRTSLEAVAAETDISKALILSLFGSKDALHLRCVQEAGEVLVAAITEVLTASPAEYMASDTLRCIFESLRHRRYDWELLHDTTVLETTEGGRAAITYRAAIRSLAMDGTYALLGPRGPVDPVDREILADVWLGILSALVSWYQRHIDEVSIAEMLQRCTTVAQTVGNVADIAGRSTGRDAVRDGALDVARQGR